MGWMVLAISSIGKKKDVSCIVVSNIINLFMHAFSDYILSKLIIVALVLSLLCETSTIIIIT